jgi:tRNA A37 N6-isopentenylltransferase MiaA
MEEAVMLTQQGTRRYAKRQWTWFRREPGVNWFAVDPRDSGWWAAPLEFAVRAFGGG